MSDTEEKFGADCNHTGQSFICEHCVAAALADKDAEIERLQARAKVSAEANDQLRDDCARLKAALTEAHRKPRGEQKWNGDVNNPHEVKQRKTARGCAVFDLTGKCEEHDHE